MILLTSVSCAALPNRLTIMGPLSVTVPLHLFLLLVLAGALADTLLLAGYPVLTFKSARVAKAGSSALRYVFCICAGAGSSAAGDTDLAAVSRPYAILSCLLHHIYRLGAMPLYSQQRSLQEFGVSHSKYLKISRQHP